ncbi:hypothetical protein CC2G_014295 [Coprinopsis cinerea AmutBmut pab1-1]|nr:hypothetical protein CC2G_014295 [Coprinopsis cinerea AmutBmut pab1-1]
MFDPEALNLHGACSQRRCPPSTDDHPPTASVKITRISVLRTHPPPRSPSHPTVYRYWTLKACSMHVAFNRPATWIPPIPILSADIPGLDSISPPRDPLSHPSIPFQCFNP